MDDGLQKLMRAQIERRTEGEDLAPLIEALIEDRYVPTIALPAEMDKGQAIEVHESLKVERNALVSILVAEAWRESKEARDSYQFIDQVHQFPDLDDELNRTVRMEKDAALSLYIQTGHILHEAIDEVCARHIEASVTGTTSVDVVFKRFSDVLRACDFAAIDDESDFIKRGANTITAITWGLIRLIPTLAERNGISLTEAEMITAIRSGYGPLLVQIASTNIEVGPQIMMNLMPGPTVFNDLFFDLQKDAAGNYKLVFDHEALDGDPDRFYAGSHPYTPAKFEPRSPTTWCPARYTPKLKVDVIREYFDWSLELAKKHYFPTLSTP